MPGGRLPCPGCSFYVPPPIWQIRYSCELTVRADHLLGLGSGASDDKARGERGWWLDRLPFHARDQEPGCDPTLLDDGLAHRRQRRIGPCGPWVVGESDDRQDARRG